MRIAYCEDEAAQAGLVRSMMERWADSRKEPVEVILFESGACLAVPAQASHGR